jgi:hypothetical protein|tara:strand:+ start:1329 stop:2222 length:894 start_codon:yes stop_codon:yes gene_type:complete
VKKLFGILILTLLTAANATNYNPQFVVDYNNCGTNPSVATKGSVSFGTTTCAAGRVISNQAYKNITQITATVDLSKATSTFVNHTFYMVSNPTNPTRPNSGSAYCDAGGNLTDQNCREIDLFESNANAVIQTTIHTGNGGINGPQRFELAYTDTAISNPTCFDSSKMSDNPAAGSHKLAGIIDITKPVQMIVNFTYGDTPTYKVTYTQGSNSVVVYDSTVGSGYSGSGAIDMKDLITSMANGYWIHASIWQSSPSVPYDQQWSPGKPQGWWISTCQWGGLCGSTTSFSLSNVTVIAD